MMKRTSMPKFWPLERKNKMFVVESRPGPHTKETSIPAGVLIRDIFSVARNITEAKTVLNSGKVEVNGKVCKDYRLPVGLMDVIGLGDETYRMVPTVKGLKPVKVTDGNLRLAKIRNKTALGKEMTQLNIYNGYNMVVKKDDYKTDDSLVLDNKTSSIKGHIKFGKGVLVIVTDGNNIGKIGKVESIHVTKNMQPTILALKVDDEKIIVPKKYMLVIGDDKPAVQLGIEGER